MRCPNSSPVGSSSSATASAYALAMKQASSHAINVFKNNILGNTVLNGHYRGGEAYLSNAPTHPAGKHLSFIHTVLNGSSTPYTVLQEHKVCTESSITDAKPSEELLSSSTCHIISYGLRKGLNQYGNGSLEAGSVVHYRFSRSPGLQLRGAHLLALVWIQSWKRGATRASIWRRPGRSTVHIAMWSSRNSRRSSAGRPASRCSCLSSSWGNSWCQCQATRKYGQCDMWQDVRTGRPVLLCVPGVKCAAVIEYDEQELSYMCQ